ncbi:hypothetical protein CSUI_006475 [Cystoisospora suis]|uniref:Uncharacterized protein n=1 Tax=Cystoisospora suis TaxID=483139 RepID=A0A2C6KUC6_9APIC|nr:hypothetical protein CSUI_006475 [Cystoisospora suis]
MTDLKNWRERERPASQTVCATLPRGAPAYFYFSEVKRGSRNTRLEEKRNLGRWGATIVVIAGSFSTPGGPTVTLSSPTVCDLLGPFPLDKATSPRAYRS